jgi:hypothetical protein
VPPAVTPAPVAVVVVAVSTPAPQTQAPPVAGANSNGSGGGGSIAIVPTSATTGQIAAGDTPLPVAATTPGRTRYILLHAIISNHSIRSQ